MNILIASVVFFARPQTICIDPGHPSETSRGTAGRHVTEIRVAWRIARLLEAKLRHDGVTVVLTKGREDQLVTNRRRAEIANQARAALMLRLHCDAGSGSGFAVYYPAKQGVVQGVLGPSRAVTRSSRQAAIRVHDAMRLDLRGSLLDNGLKTDSQTAVGARQGALTGSIFSTVPVVLVEMVVLGNPKDEEWIQSKVGEAKMVLALEQGALSATRR